MAGEGTARFPSTMRLKRRSEFQRVFREGIMWKGRCFSVHGLYRQPRSPEEMQEHPRIGIVVPKKVGSAVERNRIKRRLREAFRKDASRLPPMDLIVVPNRNCLEAIDRELQVDLERAARRTTRRSKEMT